MKVFLKEAITAEEVRHPFIVRLRYAFQSEVKLYLVTDYYRGGSLCSYLRRSGRPFTEDHARFYAAELLSALDHLHRLNIIHRCLKLENLLLDSQGHLALTDFSRAKQNIDIAGGTATFCGATEYIAPEILRGQKYSTPVDWWAFGVLLFEMLHGKTPFYDKNRKLMFNRILNTEPSYPPTFSSEVIACIQGLLKVEESQRLGSRSRGGQEIMECDFFRVIDFAQLFRKEIPPPFVPEIVRLASKKPSEADIREFYDENSGSKNKGDSMFEEFDFVGERYLDA